MKHIKVILAGLMIVLVMVASTNFMVGIHFCMGDIQEVSLFTEASGCEMQKAFVAPCHKHLQEPCCDDETVMHESDEFSSSANELALAGPDLLQLAALPVLIAEVIPATTTTNNYALIYDPPLRSADIIVEHRSLLI